MSSNLEYSEYGQSNPGVFDSWFRATHPSNRATWEQTDEPDEEEEEENTDE